MNRQTVAALVLACLLFTRPASATSILVNGDFETGDLTGWTRLPACNCMFSAFGVGSIDPHTGQRHLQFSGNLEIFVSSGLEDAIEQTVPTVAGELYNLSFWLHSFTANPPQLCCANELRVQWNGAVAFATLTIQPTADYVLYSLPLLATGPTSVLRVGGMNLTGFTRVDDITLSAVPEPASFGLVALGLLVVATRRRAGLERFRVGAPTTGAVQSRPIAQFQSRPQRSS
jgi:hypothetical protein